MFKEKNKKTTMRGFLTFVFTLTILVLSISINTVKVSAKTIDDGEKDDATKIATYVLTLEERGGVKEEIRGADIGLKYNPELANGIGYDQNLLNDAISKLVCFTNVVNPQNARIQYENGYGYVIVNEVQGNKVNKNNLYNSILKAIINREETLNLETANCYESPAVLANSQTVINAKDTLNKYISSDITYNFAGNVWKVDGSKIKDWVSIDGNYQVTLDESMARNFVNSMAEKYQSQLGKSIKVSGGYDGNNHSWVIDTATESTDLINYIKNGQTINKSPAYSQTNSASYFSNVGDTFIEIDMTKQHLWYYKNGYLLVDGPIVTGNVSLGHTTPSGIYKLYYKQKDTVLRGEDYASPVNFWMPFNGNIGLHDASWRSEFGGEIYKTNGSHGCVNLPYSVAKTIYDNIRKGEVIICHN